jgi:DNA recombination protein RmuC
VLLLPLQERIREFQQQVSTTYDTESKERLTLKNEIERLARQSNKLSEDAVNLAQVLKGNNKIQGVWGEMVLETVLEAAGLRKGEAYTIQESYSNTEGQQQRPDVVVHLPERKHLVVDAKVSLVAYERLCSASDDTLRAVALKDHLRSLRTHIKELSERNYPGLPDLRDARLCVSFHSDRARLHAGYHGGSGSLQRGIHKTCGAGKPHNASGYPKDDRERLASRASESECPGDRGAVREAV